jgi:hypothetical protein
MKAEISISQVYYNASLLNFFFRTQSTNTFNELFEKCEQSNDEIFEAIENYSNDLDEVEELFYDESLSDICEALGLEISNDDDDE